MWKKLLIIYLVSMPIYAGTILDDVSDSKYIEYGKNIDCVVEMIGKVEDKVKSSFSGVIIHPNWIITSAHTMDNNHKFYFLLHNKEIAISEFFIHPKYIEEEFGSMDISLCYIKEPIKIEYIPDLYKDNDEIGKVCCIVGYGMTGTGNTGAQKYDHKKRAGTNRVIGEIKNMIMCDMSRRGNKSTVLEFCIAPGDSGGGLFIDKKLAGINSCVIFDNKNKKHAYDDESGHIKISNEECWKWIEYIIHE